MDIQLFKDASARLNPLRQMLADVALVADTTANLFQQKNEVEAQIGQLQLQRDELMQQVQDAVNAASAAQATGAEVLVALQHQVAEAQSEAAEAKVALQKEVERAQQEAQQAIAQAQATHAHALATFAQQKADAEQALQQAQEYVKAMSNKLKDFV